MVPSQRNTIHVCVWAGKGKTSGHSPHRYLCRSSTRACILPGISVGESSPPPPQRGHCSLLEPPHFPHPLCAELARAPDQRTHIHSTYPTPSHLGHGTPSSPVSGLVVIIWFSTSPASAASPVAASAGDTTNAAGGSCLLHRPFCAHIRRSIFPFSVQPISFPLCLGPPKPFPCVPPF